MIEPTKFERIVIAYRVLVELAQKRETITYEEMANAMQANNPQHVGRHLDPIAIHLLLTGLPALTTLVVHKGNRRPGKGLLASQATFDETCLRVYDHDWDPNLFDPLLA